MVDGQDLGNDHRILGPEAGTAMENECYILPALRLKYPEDHGGETEQSERFSGHDWGCSTFRGPNGDPMLGGYSYAFLSNYPRGPAVDLFGR